MQSDIRFVYFRTLVMLYSAIIDYFNTLDTCMQFDTRFVCCIITADRVVIDDDLITMEEVRDVIRNKA